MMCGTIQEADLAEDLMMDGYVKSFVIWETFLTRAFPISEIQCSTAGDERSSIYQLCEKQHEMSKDADDLMDVWYIHERQKDK